MLEELAGNVFLRPVRRSEHHRNRQNIEAIHRHPTGAVRLLDVISRTERLGAVKDAYVVEPEETALEYIFSFRILAVYPPGEINQQLVKHADEKLTVFFSLYARRDFIYAPSRPRMHWRVHVGKIPFIGRQLAIGFHVPFAHEEHELL